MRTSVSEIAAPAFAVQAIEPDNTVGRVHEEYEVADLAIQGIAGAAGLAVRLIWSARIML